MLKAGFLGLLWLLGHEGILREASITYILYFMQHQIYASSLCSEAALIVQAQAL